MADKSAPIGAILTALASPGGAVAVAVGDFGNQEADGWTDD